MPYVIDDGHLLTRSLEIHVTDHCNLRCRECCTLSPFLAERYVDPEEMRRDLALARAVLRPEFLKLSGGEPLLHPRLIDCLRVARESGIARTVSVTTNGLLLHEMPDYFWRFVQHVTISVYPSARIPAERRVLMEERAREHGVELRIKQQNEFEELTLDTARSDEEATAAIFEGCWMKRRCHLLRDGVFYMCTRPPHFDSYFGTPDRFSVTDGVPLHDGPGLLRDVQTYLERTKPIGSCRHCWGGQGRKFSHEQLAPGHPLFPSPPTCPP